MGYARPEQKSAGIHQRQFCRSFVIGDSNKRVAFVSVDAGMISQLVKIEVKYFWVTKDNLNDQKFHSHEFTFIVSIFKTTHKNYIDLLVMGVIVS